MGELLDRPVRDVDGRRLGRVREVRLVADGAGPGPRLAALVVGPLCGGDRLGFGEAVSAPWLLARLFAAVRRHRYLVEWDEVACVAPVVRLRLPRDRLRGST